eukprot:CAMPEP_0198142762 /NCGR_PEP_ID=MMETSP1443-20131203/5464_1 /TAXON_ID=186043 /ORGANISM="Entomoneis sp., Strain CCMP2396" /LENGTH=493 /DNA_ID=CAMNT_0043805847 /DNA_START=72 /DNA_END=1553 /DNA_ORIENTATION=+
MGQETNVDPDVEAVSAQQQDAKASSFEIDKPNEKENAADYAVDGNNSENPLPRASFPAVIGAWFRKQMNQSHTRSSSSALNEKLVDDDSGEIGGSLKNATASTPLLHKVLFATMAAGLALGVYLHRYSITDFDPFVDWSQKLNVAFVGNAYFFINDIPRVMESMSEGHIFQQSVIHSSEGSLPSLLLRGNGMYQTWQTNESIITTSYVNNDGDDETIYDFGLCTVAQLLTGSDDILTYGNNNKAYYNDELNPCISDETYFDYTYDYLAEVTFSWDYVVLVDQTKRVAIKSARQNSIYALTYAYGPLIAKTKAIPVIVDTHSFWSESTNMTGLGDIEYFQALIAQGASDYVKALTDILPEEQTPVVAPVGVAYLTIYEERPDLWEKLFIDDGIHASLHGSYVFACVLYGTMYGHLPRRHSGQSIENLFAKSRMLVGQYDLKFPTRSEASYYRNVARRVALGGHVPGNLRKLIEQLNTVEEEDLAEDGVEDEGKL